jgi:hypothetical protein
VEFEDVFVDLSKIFLQKAPSSIYPFLQIMHALFWYKIQFYTGIDIQS